MKQFSKDGALLKETSKLSRYAEDNDTVFQGYFDFDDELRHTSASSGELHLPVGAMEIIQCQSYFNKSGTFLKDARRNSIAKKALSILQMAEVVVEDCLVEGADKIEFDVKSDLFIAGYSCMSGPMFPQKSYFDFLGESKTTKLVTDLAELRAFRDMTKLLIAKIGSEKIKKARTELKQEFIQKHGREMFERLFSAEDIDPFKLFSFDVIAQEEEKKCTEKLAEYSEKKNFSL